MKKEAHEKDKRRPRRAKENFYFIITDLIKINSIQGAIHESIIPWKIHPSWINLSQVTGRRSWFSGDIMLLGWKLADAERAVTLRAQRTASCQINTQFSNPPQQTPLSSPHSGVLIGEESTFNFSLSRFAVCPAVLQTPFFPPLNGIFQGESERVDVRLRHLHSTGSADLMSSCHGEITWQLCAWEWFFFFPFSFSPLVHFCHLNMINLFV